MTDTSTDSEWLEWIELQKSVVKTGFAQGDVPEAIEMLDRYLAESRPDDLKREALAFRADLCSTEGDLEAAKADFLSALNLAAEQDHVRFELEDSLVRISVEQGDSEEADKWFRAALRTAAADPRVAGGGLLLRLLSFRGKDGLTDEEHGLVAQIVRQSWHLLRVEGEPDLEDLEGTARKLIEAQRGPFSADRPPAPKTYSGPTE